jgi:hypothetical protein
MRLTQPQSQVEPETAGLARFDITERAGRSYRNQIMTGLDPRRAIR